jgi:hypothetical protein
MKKPTVSKPEENKQPVVQKDAKGNPIKGKVDPKAVQPVQIEEVKPPPPKEKNLERFIYVTTYNDSDTMKILKELFENINKDAFNLKSVKETYTKTLSLNEQNDNLIDYISGFQLIDSNIRITILEGIAGKGMKKVKEALPKLKLNDNLNKVFSDSRILFDTRIYSKFNLCLKYIKLRDTLSNILTTYDIYMKANKYKEIYTAFMNLGFILQSQTFEEISHSNLFPPAENLLLLERKYADILNDEDMTGIHKQLTTSNKKKKHTTENSENAIKNNNTSLDVKNSGEKKENSKKNTKDRVSTKSYSHSPASSEKTGENISIRNFKAKLDSRNFEFMKFKETKKLQKVNPHKTNLEYLNTLNQKADTQSFCMHQKKYDKTMLSPQTFTSGIEATTLVTAQEKTQAISNTTSNIPKPMFLYSSQKKNYYDEYLNEIRDKIKNDHDNYYTYSKDYLTLSFPMLKNGNKVYDEYIENKKVKDRNYI